MYSLFLILDADESSCMVKRNTIDHFWEKKDKQELVIFLLAKEKSTKSEKHERFEDFSCVFILC